MHTGVPQSTQTYLEDWDQLCCPRVAWPSAISNWTRLLQQKWEGLVNYMTLPLYY